jgi:hypothetical protein
MKSVGIGVVKGMGLRKMEVNKRGELGHEFVGTDFASEQWGCVAGVCSRMM